MNAKNIIWIGMIGGTMLGGSIPSLWGSGPFSMAGVLCSALGGFLGIWVGFRLSK